MSDIFKINPADFPSRKGTDDSIQMMLVPEEAKREQNQIEIELEEDTLIENFGEI